ncbi:MAG TPA: hypothetical protein VEA16_02425, partial [Vicinamibacterales bacterium]|nr:hypothetical protein [Vicinamibacterales bacterium]
HVGACVTVNDDGDEFFNILIQMNDSSRVVQQTASVQGQHIQSICVSADVRVASTADFVTVKVAQQSLGSSASIYAESTGTPIGFWAHRVSS